MMPGAPRILVAGVGNIFLGDDAFGSEVAQQLLRRPHPSHVRVVDFGIRGLDLVYALLDGCETAILIDVTPRPGELPGTLFVLEPPLKVLEQSSPVQIDAHSMDPVKVLQTALAMGARPGKILIVGCQPTSVPSPDDDGTETPLEMSRPVTAAVPEAVMLVESLIEKLLAGTFDAHSKKPQEVTPCSP